MKGGSHAKGFTIIETLIVLAVTSALFIGALALIGGRQGKTQFAQSARDVESQLQQIMNEVSSGYYSSTEDFKCEKSGGKPVIETVSLGTPPEQGSNKDCIFMGKIIQMSIDNPDAATFNVYSLVGLREATEFSDAAPRLLARSSADAASVPDIYESEKISFSPTVGSLKYNNTTEIGAFGFVSRLGATLGSDDNTEQLDLVAIPGTARGTNKLDGVSDIHDNLGSIITNPAGGVQLCLFSGTADQSALITIGGQGRPITVSSTIKGTANCS